MNEREARRIRAETRARLEEASRVEFPAALAEVRRRLSRVPDAPFGWEKRLTSLPYEDQMRLVLELLMRHANGGSIVAMPISCIAKELRCSPIVVRRLLDDLEDDGFIRRSRGLAPGNLYVTEIVGVEQELDSRPLSPMDEELLDALATKRDLEGVVRTNEYELARDLDVPYETVLVSLMNLKQRGYLSSAFALYGRPLVVKVHHARPAASARKQRRDNADKLARFIEWREGAKREEEERFQQLLSEIGEEVANV